VRLNGNDDDDDDEKRATFSSTISQQQKEKEFYDKDEEELIKNLRIPPERDERNGEVPSLPNITSSLHPNLSLSPNFIYFFINDLVCFLVLAFLQQNFLLTWITLGNLLDFN